MAWTDLTVVTERIVLRPFVETDKPAIIDMRTDAQVYRYLGGPAGPEFAEEIAGATVGEQWGVFAIADRATDAAIGSTHFSRDRGELEVSYELLPTHWGQGLAFEAVGATIGWAGAHLDDDTVIAVTQTANAKSVALLERLGFEFVRAFEEFDAEQGEFRRLVQREPMGG